MVYDTMRIISNKSGQHVLERIVKDFPTRMDKMYRDDFVKNLKNAFSKFFPSGEKYVQLQGNSRKRDIHIITSFHNPELYHLKRKIVASDLDINTKADLIENYMHTLEPDFRETEKICDGARRSGATGISVYFTYYPDCRQDKKDESHVPISAKLTMDNLTSSAEPRLDRIGIVDIHAEQTQGFTNLPVDEIKCRYFFLTHLKHDFGSLDDVVLIFPDGGSYGRFDKEIKYYELKYAIIGKSRPEHGKADIEHYMGSSPKGKVAVIIDDMVDGGGTTINAAEEISRLGAKEVRAYCTHFIGSTKVKRNKESNEVEQIEFAEDKFKDLKMKVYSFDTIPRTDAYRQEHSAWLTQFSVAPYIADLIHCSIVGGSHGNELNRYKNIAKNGTPEQIKKEVERMTIKF